MILEFKGLSVGDSVFFHDRGGWFPAVVTQIYPLEAGKEVPDLGMVALMTGFSGGASPKLRVSHGNEFGQWLSRYELEQLLAEPTKGLSDTQKEHLALLKKIEEEQKPLGVPIEIPKQPEPDPEKKAKKEK